MPSSATTHHASPSRPWRDTREWLAHVRALGELSEVHGIDWQDGIGAATALLDATDGAPAVLFDDVPGYPSGRRVLVNSNGTLARQAVTLGLLPEQATHEAILDFWRHVLAGSRTIPPVEVATGPVFENRVEGDAVDLEAFPVPVWHPKDGGRYIGTASLNILRDPDSGWINLGTYRNEIFSRNEMGIWISPGKHGRLIRERYATTGSRVPIVVVVGADPLLFLAAAAPIPYGVDELAWAGGVRGEPIEIVRGPVTGLPFPATSEIAIEGWIDADRWHEEGPYGEFHGYYGYGEGRTPVIEVAAIHHRDDPILLGCPQGKPPHEDNRALAYLRAAQIEAALAAAGVPRITGVWCPPVAAERFLTIVAVDQAYPGHATQALTVAGQTGAAAYIARMVVAVDPDIDIFDMNDVLWAMTTRVDPERDTTIVGRAWSGPLDPPIHPDDRGMSSRILIDATRPWEWRERFAAPVVTAEQARETRRRWSWILDPDAADPRGG